MRHEPDAAPDEKRAARLASILETAAACFRRTGYEQTSMSALSAAAGVSKVAIYRYVPTKEQLLFEIIKSYHEELTVILERFEGTEAEPMTELATFCENWVRLNARNPARSAVYHRDLRFLGPEHRAMLGDLGRPRRVVTSIVQRGQRDGVFDPALDAKIAGLALLASLNWTYQWFDPAGELSDEDVAALGARFALSAVRP